MYNLGLENRLIEPEITDLLQDYVSIQIDIDITKVKAAALVAQEIDIKRVIGQANLDRVIQLDIYDEATPEADLNLRNLLLAPWCYYTYARCLSMFQGTFTDSGFAIEEGAASKDTAKAVANEMKGIGDSFMNAVVEFLHTEDPNTVADDEKLTPRIRAFGGQERRASN